MFLRKRKAKREIDPSAIQAAIEAKRLQIDTQIAEANVRAFEEIMTCIQRGAFEINGDYIGVKLPLEWGVREDLLTSRFEDGIFTVGKFDIRAEMIWLALRTNPNPLWDNR